MNIENLALRTRQCKAIVPDTKQRCKRRAVNIGTIQKKVIYDPRTGERKKVPITNEKGQMISSSPEFCEMHQPNKIPKCKCKCHNHSETSSGPTFKYDLTDEQLETIKRGNTRTILISINQSYFGNKPLKKKKQVKRNYTKRQSKK